MKRKRMAVTMTVLLLILSSTAGYAFAKKPAASPSPSPAVKKYACPMFCVLSEKPGKCPKCGMEMWEASEA